MSNNELLGTLALVHPGLENDPEDRQGKIGIVTYVDKQIDEVYLSFDNGQEGVFPIQTLLTLKKKDRLFPQLMDQASTLNLRDFKDLYKIGILQDRGRGVDTWQALEIARDNPGIWHSTLLPLKEERNIGLIKSTGR